MNSDFLLIQRMRKGDDEAFDIFVNKYYGEILKYCRHHCSDMKDAEDLTQETFMNFFAKFSEYRYRGKTKNFLYTIAGNLCKNYYSKRKDMPVDGKTAEKEGLQGDMDSIDCALDRVMIESALKQLSGELREVIVLYYFQDLKLSEVAGTLKIGLPLVKYRLKRAKKQLKQIIGSE